MKLVRVAAALAVGLGAVLVSAAPASAYHECPLYEREARAFSYDDGALVCFEATGEHLYVCDNKSDGHHPGVVYSINGGPWVGRDFDIGYPNCTDINLDIPETGTIKFQPRNYEGGFVWSYGPYVEVSAAG